MPPFTPANETEEEKNKRLREKYGFGSFKSTAPGSSSQPATQPEPETNREAPITPVADILAGFTMNVDSSIAMTDDPTTNLLSQVYEDNPPQAHNVRAEDQTLTRQAEQTLPAQELIDIAQQVVNLDQGKELETPAAIEQQAAEDPARDTEQASDRRSETQEGDAGSELSDLFVGEKDGGLPGGEEMEDVILGAQDEESEQEVRPSKRRRVEKLNVVLTPALRRGLLSNPPTLTESMCQRCAHHITEDWNASSWNGLPCFRDFDDPKDKCGRCDESNHACLAVPSALCRSLNLIIAERNRLIQAGELTTSQGWTQLRNKGKTWNKSLQSYKQKAKKKGEVQDVSDVKFATMKALQGIEYRLTQLVHLKAKSKGYDLGDEETFAREEAPHEGDE